MTTQRIIEAFSRADFGPNSNNTRNLAWHYTSDVSAHEIIRSGWLEPRIPPESDWPIELDRPFVYFSSRWIPSRWADNLYRQSPESFIYRFGYSIALLMAWSEWETICRIRGKRYDRLRTMGGDIYTEVSKWFISARPLRVENLVIEAIPVQLPSEGGRWQQLYAPGLIADGISLKRNTLAAIVA